MLVAKAPGFSDQRLTRVKIEDNPVVLMARQGGVEGRVVSLGDDQPVESFVAIVRAVAPGSTVYGRSVTRGKFTSADGTFELGSLESGNYVMQIEAPGYAPTYSESFIVSQGLVTPDVLVSVGQGGSVTGRLVSSTTGEPIAGALVETYDNNYVSNPFTDMLGAMVPRMTTSRKTRTDKDGNFRIELITATTYMLQVDHEDFPRKVLKDIQVREGGTTELGTIRIASGAVIRGTVYDDAGNPLANAKINLTGLVIHPGNVRTDSDGRFLIKNIQEGTYKLSAVRPSNDVAANPFGPIIDMKRSEVQITVFEGREITQNLSLGDD
jgi:protocatechuate 3,4-dioxygenase beta subunit